MPFVNRWIVIAIAFAVMGTAIAGLHLTLKVRTLERDAAIERETAYRDTLKAYQDNFAAQVNALDSEKRREIKRQENLLLELNMIGDLDDHKLPPVPAAAVSVIDRMYRPAK